MIRVVEGYSGGIEAIDLGIVEVYNAVRSSSESWAYRPFTLDDIRELFRYTWFDPEEFAVAMLGGRVVGVAWAWRASRSFEAAVYVDLRLPEYLKKLAVEYLLSWVRHSFEKRGMRGTVSISCWHQYSELCSLIRCVVSSGVESTWGTLMVYRGLDREYGPPSGYRIRFGSLDDVPSIVEVHNKAFSKYDWFYPWTVEDAKKLYARENPIIIVAEDSTGRIVGYIDAVIFKALDGGTTALLGTLAVDPEHQGRGLGKALVCTAVRELRKRGIDRIYLDGVEGLEPLYRKLGFVEYRKWVRLLAPIPSLPRTLPTYEVFGSKRAEASS